MMVCNSGDNLGTKPSSSIRSKTSRFCCESRSPSISIIMERADNVRLPRLRISASIPSLLICVGRGGVKIVETTVEGQYHPHAAPGTQPGRDRLVGHARQLALKPRLPELRRHPRSRLPGTISSHSASPQSEPEKGHMGAKLSPLVLPAGVANKVPRHRVASFSDAKLSEDGVEQVLDINAAGDAAERADGEAEVFGGKVGLRRGGETGERRGRLR